jgi:hypothetical protein
MSDTVFRARIEPVAENKIEAISSPAQPVITDVPVPYLDSRTFLDDYFNLGTEWKDHDATFQKEIDTINTYLTEKIKTGEIENSQKAVTTVLKGMERLNNLSKEGRSVIRLEVLGNYIEFLAKNDNLKSNLKRYGNA